MWYSVLSNVLFYRFDQIESFWVVYVHVYDKVRVNTDKTQKLNVIPGNLRTTQKI